MRLDIPIILIVIGVCAILGYLVFTISYIPDSEVGIYIFEYPINEEVTLYTVLGGSHQYYMLHRNFIPTLETMTIQNQVDEELTMKIIERHADTQNDRPFELIFPPRSEEFLSMYLTIAMRELIIFGAGAIVILLITKHKPHLPFSLPDENAELRKELEDHPVTVNIGETIIDSPRSSDAETYPDELPDDDVTKDDFTPAEIELAKEDDDK